MAMQKVDLGGERKTFKAVELPRYRIVVREELAEKADKELSRFEAMSATGVAKRIDITKEKRRKETAAIIEWILCQGLSMAYKVVVPDNSVHEMVAGPAVFHQSNVGKKADWGCKAGFSSEDPELQEAAKAHPKGVMRPDYLVQWSGDVNFPYNLSGISDGEILLKAMQICSERGWVYPIKANNWLWALTKRNARLWGWMGGRRALRPGDQISDKHRVVYEKEHTCRSPFTPKEEKFFQEQGWDKVQLSAGEKLGFDMEEMYQGLVDGKLDGELLKPGVKVDFTAAIPHQWLLRRELSFWKEKGMMDEPGWWKEKNRVDENGVVLGFGENEEKEFLERIERYGYTDVDEEALFKGKLPENLSAECEIPEGLL